ncbi:hypothetical protein Esti_005646 [Eimeria stiedai]
MSFVSQPARSQVAEPHVDEREALVASGSRCYDAIVRSNIQTIRGNLQSIEANLRNLNRNFISRRIVESLHDKLKQTFEVILQTETTFKAWLQEQQHATASSQEALEKQRDKFLFEKLFAHFQAEIKRVQELSERVRDAAERAAEPGTSGGGVAGVGDDQQTSHLQNSEVILDMENAGAYGDAGDPDSLFITEDSREIAEFDLVTENDALLSRAVAEERFQGIRRIHAQANHIFKDLANLIFSQGETLTSIETQMQDAHAHSKSATVELRKASRIQQRSRQRRCFLVLFICVLVFLILYSLNVFSFFAFLRSSTVNTEPLRVAVVRGGPSREAALSSSEEGPPPAPLADTTGETPAVSASNEEVIFAPPTASPAVAVQSARGLMKGGFKPQLPAP